MKTWLPLFLIVALIVLVGCEADEGLVLSESNPPLSAVASSTYYVYMSPIGSDSGSGTIDSPFATLWRVHSFLNSHRYHGDVIVRIRSDQGDYINQSVEWTYYNELYNITFESYPSTRFAHFYLENGLSMVPFFTLEADDGKKTNLHFQRLAIQNYNQGVFWFTGSVADSTKWNGYNSIVNCEFTDIGNLRMPEAGMCYGVLDLVNSRHNTIRDCTFFRCANANLGMYPQLPGAESIEEEATEYVSLPVIGIYLAHYSSNNYIARNSFLDIKGDAIRIRDVSNQNMIYDNYFEKAGWTADITMWYCVTSFGCTYDAECPSWETYIYENIAEGNWKCGTPRLFYDLRPQNIGFCFPLPDDEEPYIETRVRAHFYGNTISECSGGEENLKFRKNIKNEH